MNWDMVGNAWAINLLHSHVVNGDLRHAYLFTGPPGVGKKTLAYKFIQAVCCSDPPQIGEFCGECRSCTLIPQNAYADLHLITTGGSERFIKVDQIRNLRRQLSLSPIEGKRRVALLTEFHHATDQAANALLKTLEEPPPQVIMLLTAQSKDALLPTIVSRCEVISLRAMAVTELAAFLQEQGEVEEHALLLAGLAGGRPGRAMALRQNPTLLERRKILLDEMMEQLVSSRPDRFAYVETWIRSLGRQFRKLEDRRQKCLEVLDVWLGLWRDILLVAYGIGDPGSNPDRKREVEMLAQAIPIDQILKVVKTIQDTISSIENNANLRLALEALMLDLPKVDKELSEP